MALIAGIVLAAVSALINLTVLSYALFWAIIVIAIDVLVIWALVSARRQAKSAWSSTALDLARVIVPGGPPHADISERGWSA